MRTSDRVSWPLVWIPFVRFGTNEDAMPPIRCKTCGQQTLVLSTPTMRRHCPSCGAALSAPLAERRERLTERVREYGSSSNPRLALQRGKRAPKGITSPRPGHRALP